MAQYMPDKIDLLIGNTMAQAPEVLHHIFALEGTLNQLPPMCCRNANRVLGANEVLAGLTTEEQKVAYLVHAIAVELYLADKSIDATVRPTQSILSEDYV